MRRERTEFAFMKKTVITSLLALFLIATGRLDAVDESSADEIPWNVARVDLKADNEPTSSLLEKFGRMQGIPMVIGTRVGGKVSGSFVDVDAHVFLDAVCDAKGLAWFYDGVKIHVERKVDLLVRHIPVQYVSVDSFRNAMWNLGFASGPAEAGGNVKQGRRGGFIALSGVPNFVALAESLIAELDGIEAGRQGEKGEEIVTRHFRLKYASASDQLVQTGGSEIKIAGMATILQEMLGKQTSGSSLSTGDITTRSASRLVSRRMMGLTAATAGRSGEQSTYEGGGSGDGGRNEDASADQYRPFFEPTITANTRLNGVIVKDTVSRISLYENLIRELDVPTRIIEIRCSIVDVNSDDKRIFSTEFLGNYLTGRGEVRHFGFDADRGKFDGNDIEGQTPSFVDGADLARGVGGRLSTLITGDSWDILTRIKAMEEKGIAQVVTSPMVLTEENREANIRVDSTVYVRLQGERDVDLTEVTTGVQFRVTPSVMEEDGKRNFNMRINITDGSFVDQSVDDIPATHESAITTSANVPENRTLLLGGYFVEKKFNNRRQVPILGDIPIVGRLFGSREKTHGRMQRFFFLTPRLVNAQDPGKLLGGETFRETGDDYLEMVRQKEIPIVSAPPTIFAEIADTRYGQVGFKQGAQAVEPVAAQVVQPMKQSAQAGQQVRIPTYQSYGLPVLPAVAPAAGEIGQPQAEVPGNGVLPEQKSRTVQFRGFRGWKPGRPRR